MSIKRADADAQGTSIGVQPGGRFVLRNGRIAALIGEAYPTDVSEYVGAPSWVTTDRYDVTAKAPDGTTRAAMAPMFKALLAERFKLNARYETREDPIYHLVRARADAALPRGLTKIDLDCAAMREARQRGEIVPATPPLANGMQPCSTRMQASDAVRLMSGGMTMAGLARQLAGMVGRVVVDRTGLEGDYAFALTWSDSASHPDDLATLFTALPEQVGLKLESTRGPVRFLVIEHIERPAED